MGDLIALVQGLAASAGGLLRTPFLLFVRLYWGWQLIENGWGKLHNIGRVTQFFASLGLPAPGLTAHGIATLELLTGVLFVLGLATRLIAVPMTINLIVAYVTADREALLSFLSDPGKFYNADPFTFLMASAILFVFGPGAVSIDALVNRYAAKPPDKDARY
jgi:putative oxidoreductase